MATRGAGGRFKGDGRGSSNRRCALPTTAFLVTPSRRPISAVDRPCFHNAESCRMSSDVQTESIAPPLYAVGLACLNYKIRYHSRDSQQAESSLGARMRGITAPAAVLRPVFRRMGRRDRRTEEANSQPNRARRQARPVPASPPFLPGERAVAGYISWSDEASRPRRA